MSYWAKDGSFVREASDDAPRMTQGDVWEAEQRVAKGMQSWEEQEKQRKENERNARIEYQEMKRSVEQKEQDARAYEINKIIAVQLIIEQKRNEYNQKSWLRKAFATIQGKNFKQNYSQIKEYAEKRVENMSSSYLENFIENQQEGKTR